MSWLVSCYILPQWSSFILSFYILAWRNLSLKDNVIRRYRFYINIMSVSYEFSPAAFRWICKTFLKTVHFLFQEHMLGLKSKVTHRHHRCFGLYLIVIYFAAIFMEISKCLLISIFTWRTPPICDSRGGRTSIKR